MKQEMIDQGEVKDIKAFHTKKLIEEKEYFE